MSSALLSRHCACSRSCKNHVMRMDNSHTCFFASSVSAAAVDPDWYSLADFAGDLTNSRTSLRRCCKMLAISPEVNNEAVHILRVPMFQNNYGWLMRDHDTGKVAAVDPAEPEAIQSAMKEKCVLPPAVPVRVPGKSFGS